MNPDSRLGVGRTRRRVALAVLPVLTAAAIAWTSVPSPAHPATRQTMVATTMAPPPNSVVPFGAASLGVQALNNPVDPAVGMAPTPDGNGYWVVASDGGVFSFGDARFYGSTGSITLNRPVVGMAPTPDGRGYWLVASDGGVFSFGNARFYGSTGSITLNRPVVGIASTPDGRGYWLVASDGGIFSYGDARFDGSTGNIALNKPVVGMAATPDGRGYWLVASDGGIFSFGDARFFGSTGAITLNRPVVGMAAAPGRPGLLAGGLRRWDLRLRRCPVLRVGGRVPTRRPGGGHGRLSRGGGYWLVIGSPLPLAGKVVGIDPGHNGLNGHRAPDHRSTGVERPGDRTLRHHWNRDGRRLHGSTVQLQRRHLPAGRPPGRRGPGGHDPSEQRRDRAVRHHPGGNHQRGAG